MDWNGVSSPVMGGAIEAPACPKNLQMFLVWWKRLMFRQDALNWPHMFKAPPPSVRTFCTIIKVWQHQDKWCIYIYVRVCHIPNPLITHPAHLKKTAPCVQSVWHPSSWDHSMLAGLSPSNQMLWRGETNRVSTPRFVYLEETSPNLNHSVYIN